ncbi:hypothetical protein CCOS2040_31015 (plasmid) [Streptomyces albidoflavus]|nr:hypothetical protein [Streptomyces albidoflavus]CAI4198536.1 hypothetical protein CCOS2040_31015 [Streptomyces albidoflavus]
MQRGKAPRSHPLRSGRGACAKTLAEQLAAADGDRRRKIDLMRMQLSAPTSQMTVHVDSRQWEKEELDGRSRAEMEAEARSGVRLAAPGCIYAGLAEPDIEVTEECDGAVTVTARVLCDEPACHEKALSQRYAVLEVFLARDSILWGLRREAAPEPAGRERTPIVKKSPWTGTPVLLGAVLVCLGYAAGDGIPWRVLAAVGVCAILYGSARLLIQVYSADRRERRHLREKES